MRVIDVLSNLKNFECWDFKHYPLSKDEAEVIIQVLEATCTGGATMRTIEECIKELKERRDWGSVDEVNAVFDEILEIYKAERPKGKWIPVSERLPEESGYYIANVYIEDCYFSEVCVRWFAHPDDYFIKAGEWRECADGEVVTAWMPLPEPYKA